MDSIHYCVSHALGHMLSFLSTDSDNNDYLSSPLIVSNTLYCHYSILIFRNVIYSYVLLFLSVIDLFHNYEVYPIVSGCKCVGK